VPGEKKDCSDVGAPGGSAELGEAWAPDGPAKSRANTIRTSACNSFPADAFSAQRPHFRATSLHFRRNEKPKSEGSKPRFYVAAPSGAMLKRKIIVWEGRRSA
jgi:hypothetical protein